MDPITVHDVEAFVAPGLRGNPAGVVVLADDLPVPVMRHVARVMGHSETAFVRAMDKDDADPATFGLRWFTPEDEIALCGHATLASARVLFDVVGIHAPTIAFQTMSGVLRARRQGDDIQLDFPQDHATPVDPAPALLRDLGIAKAEDAVRSPKTGKLLLALKDEDAVRAVRPDFPALRRLPADATPRGVIITAPGRPPYDLVSRYFHPWLGVDEDPVTGSAHCLLATYWGDRLGRTALTGLQCSARGGVVRTDLVAGDRVTLTGEARIVGIKRVGAPASDATASRAR